MNVLVTGGAGFIGSNLARCLAASGERVRVLDNLSTGSLDNLAEGDGVEVAIAGPRPRATVELGVGVVDVLVGDVRDRDTVREAVAGVEVVYHLAALPSVTRSVSEPEDVHAVNVNGTLGVLLAAREAGARRVVYASSSSVYGDTPVLPKHEELPPAPQSPYAASKLAGEAYCRAFSRVYGLETVSLRFFNVFGPRQDPRSQYAAAIPRFVTRMLGGEPPVVFGDGLQTRDFTFVANAVQACLLAATADGPAVGEVVNVGCGGRTSLLDLVAMLNELLGTDIRPTFAEPRPGDIHDSEAAIGKAERLLGYRPLIDVRQGLAETVAWFSRRGALVARPATRSLVAEA